jgi:hypothetical protein
MIWLKFLPLGSGMRVFEGLSPLVMTKLAAVYRGPSCDGYIDPALEKCLE